jgi:hypothetical protein
MTRFVEDPLSGLHRAVLQGGGMGAAAGALFAHQLGGAPGIVAFGAALGACTGCVSGLLTWIGTADLPEAPIPPVRAPTREAITRDVRGGGVGSRARPA